MKSNDNTTLRDLFISLDGMGYVEDGDKTTKCRYCHRVDNEIVDRYQG